ncbi:neurotrophin 1-like [Portunus trituberculatus]|uniref:neurotrophin 1-like n=1 Tax=Portunus trituberculatus TaxID=210409 RepID=UPI001E1D1B31|nr:neurotrophin 1-like [Portunus trituberculatus]
MEGLWCGAGSGGSSGGRGGGVSQRCSGEAFLRGKKDTLLWNPLLQHLSDGSEACGGPGGGSRRLGRSSPAWQQHRPTAPTNSTCKSGACASTSRPRAAGICQTLSSPRCAPPVPHPFSTPQPTYGQHPTHPTYRPRPTYTPTTPAYGAHPHGPAPAPSYGSDQPACAATSGKPWCLEDRDYPTYEIQAAAEQNADKLLTLYADVADLNTELSVDLPSYQTEETYLCPSETAYVRPLRAINTEGKWRIIVNGIKVHYETLTQTTRLEECLNPGYPCPLVPQCYESKCLQKSIYHRFLVYDPYDQYFPFAVETFKLPASCACLLGASTLDH